MHSSAQAERSTVPQGLQKGSDAPEFIVRSCIRHAFGHEMQVITSKALDAHGRMMGCGGRRWDKGRSAVLLKLYMG